MRQIDMIIPVVFWVDFDFHDGYTMYTGTHRLFLASFTSSPGSGCMPHILSTCTCAWPPPTSTKSWVTGTSSLVWFVNLVGYACVFNVQCVLVLLGPCVVRIVSKGRKGTLASVLDRRLDPMGTYRGRIFA